MFDDRRATTCRYPPARVRRSATRRAGVESTSQFDGWGYAHLYDANDERARSTPSRSRRRSTRATRSGFGDLSIHEFATDPETNLAYASYYAGGLRVLRFSRADGLEEVGKFIDDGGNNFWGVEQFTDAAGNRLIAGSDRDYGLYIVKYTGPGRRARQAAGAAAAAGHATAASAAAGGAEAAVVVLRVRLAQAPDDPHRRASVTITVPGPGKATATLKASIGRRMRHDRAARRRRRRAPATLRLTFRLSAAQRAVAAAHAGAAADAAHRRRAAGVLHPDGRHAAHAQQVAVDRRSRR